TDIANAKHLSDTVIELLQENAHEIGGEWADSYLDDVLISEKRESLKAKIVDWLDENAEQPTFFTAENPIVITGWWDGEEVQSNPIKQKA
ncbi:MAG: hypothetical protein GY817_02695, partial [bacterium]|nr:hypothetical protein [bacterium]